MSGIAEGISFLGFWVGTIRWGRVPTPVPTLGLDVTGLTPCRIWFVDAPLTAVGCETLDKTLGGFTGVPIDSARPPVRTTFTRACACAQPGVHTTKQNRNRIHIIFFIVNFRLIALMER